MDTENHPAPRKHFGISLDPILMKEFKHLGITLDRFTNDLLEEAMKELIEKYKKGEMSHARK